MELATSAPTSSATPAPGFVASTMAAPYVVWASQWPSILDAFMQEPDASPETVYLSDIVMHVYDSFMMV